MTTIKIKSSDLRALAAALHKEEGMLISYANFYYRQNVMTIFKRVVNQTPQFGGDLVHNWYLGIGSTSDTYDSIDGGDLWFSTVQNSQAYKMGDTENTEEPIQRAEEVVRRLAYLGKPAYIYNTTPYAEDVGANLGPTDDHGTRYPIRPVNQIDGVVQMLSHNVTWALLSGSWQQ